MLIVGLMSGTSVDGVDAVLVKVSGSQLDLQVDLIKGQTFPYPTTIRSLILGLMSGNSISIVDLVALDEAIAKVFADCAIAIRGDYQIDLIGSHGQTIFHCPPLDQQLGYSWQLGRGLLIAQLTKTATVSNFRVADISVGGHGAPLVAKVDLCLLQDAQLTRVVQNIGGIANLTYLPPIGSPEEVVLGWDTGPGNCLLDLAVSRLTNYDMTYDQDGCLAASGKIDNNLLREWLTHDYFQLPPPKSTGREVFGYQFLDNCWEGAQQYGLSLSDFLATLTELTVQSIVQSYQNFLPRLPDQVLLCGGGTKNLYLKNRLQVALGEIPLLTTDEVGLNSDFKEAIAFAILAYWNQLGIAGNLPSVTKAKKSVVLGEYNYYY